MFTASITNCFGRHVEVSLTYEILSHLPTTAFITYSKSVGNKVKRRRIYDIEENFKQFSLKEAFEKSFNASTEDQASPTRSPQE